MKLAEEIGRIVRQPLPKGYEDGATWDTTWDYLAVGVARGFDAHGEDQRFVALEGGREKTAPHVAYGFMGDMDPTRARMLAQLLLAAADLAEKGGRR